MTTPALELRHYGHDDLPEIRQTLIDVQRDVYADVFEDDEFRRSSPGSWTTGVGAPASPA